MAPPGSRRSSAPKPLSSWAPLAGLLVLLANSYWISLAHAKGDTLDWKPCPAACDGRPSLKAFLCARLTVPLDHSKPGGRNISLGLIKHPARVPSKRVGALLFNPGGPSDQGSTYLPAMHGGYDRRVLDQIDLVSWDPRGMGGFTYPYVMCFNSLEEEVELYGDTANFPPVGVADQTAWADVHASVSRKCKGVDDELLAHVSTADNARDMELIRQAIGEERVFYYGTSYGTFLGATYANMFPERLRAIALDGTVDANRWMAPVGPQRLSTFLRVGSDKANAATLKSFLTLCGQARPPGKACAFSAGSANATRRRFETLLAMAAKKPIMVDSEPVDDSALLAMTLTTLYTVGPLTAYPGHFVGWSALAEELAGIWAIATNAATNSSSSPGPLLSAGSKKQVTDGKLGADAASNCTTGNDKNYMGPERQLSVVCGESPNPTEPLDYVATADISRRRAGYGGAIWPWIAFCAGWPVRAAAPYRGPFNTTALRLPPIVIGLTGDPATPWDNAKSLAESWPGARFVSVNGYGHTTLLNPSSCAQRLVADLFIDGKAPARKRTNCKQDVVPFAVARG